METEILELLREQVRITQQLVRYIKVGVNRSNDIERMLDRHDLNIVRLLDKHKKKASD